MVVRICCCCASGCHKAVNLLFSRALFSIVRRMLQAKKAAAAGAASAAPEASVSRREQVLPLPKGIPVPQAAAQTAAAAADDTQSRQREAKWAGMTFIGVLYIGMSTPC